MTITTGELRHHLLFKRPSVTTGDPVVTEPVVLNLWGSLEGLGSTQGGLVADADYRFKSRFVTMPDGTAPTAQLVATMGSRRFTVRSTPQDPDGRRRELLWFLQETTAK